MGRGAAGGNAKGAQTVGFDLSFVNTSEKAERESLRATFTEGKRKRYDRCTVSLCHWPLRWRSPASTFRRPRSYRKEKTVVIDECSMLTLDDLHAVVMALDLAHVQD